MLSDDDSDLEPELLGDIAKLQREIDEDSTNRHIVERETVIDQALKLNEEAMKDLLNLKAQLHRLLLKTQNEMREIHSEIDAVRTTSLKSTTLSVRKFGMPYFRTDTGYTPQPNMDTVTKNRLGMVSVFDLGPGNGWTNKDKEIIRQEILRMSRTIKLEQLEEKLAELKSAKMEDKHHGNYENELVQQINNLHLTTLAQVTLPLEEEYDWQSIAYNISYRHSAGEIRAMWKLHLHPSFHQGNMSRVEYCLLQNVVSKYRYQNWDKIAQELGGMRSGYQCFVIHQTTTGDVEKGIKWTPEEDEFLRQNVEIFRDGSHIPWNAISTCFPNKTKLQIYNRYTRHVAPEIRKGRFLPEEDAVLLAAYHQFGSDWKKICRFLPGRDAHQARNRYNMSLNSTKSCVWTVEEDKKLLHFAGSMNADTINYSDMAKHLNGKNRAHIRSRYITLMAWLKKHPGKDLRMAPRRGPRQVSGAKAPKVDLKTAVESLINRLELDTNALNSKALHSVSLEEAILNIYITEIKTEVVQSEPPPLPKPNPEDIFNDIEKTLSELAEDTYCVRIILLLLKANLDKEQFNQSSFALRYNQLHAEDHDSIPKVKLKTYSRKRSETAVIAGDVTVFSDTKTYEKKYLLPPNYQILCACKNLLQEAQRGTTGRRDLSLIRNPVLRLHYNKFIERCEILFMWALFLSNTHPVDMLTSFHDIELPDEVEEFSINTSLKTESFEPKYASGHWKDKKIAKGTIDLPWAATWIDVNIDDTTLHAPLASMLNHVKSAPTPKSPTKPEAKSANNKFNDYELKSPPAKKAARGTMSDTGLNVQTRKVDPRTALIMARTKINGGRRKCTYSSTRRDETNCQRLETT